MKISLEVGRIKVPYISDLRQISITGRKEQFK